MKSFSSTVTVTVVLALFSANMLAVKADVCSIKNGLHENLATILKDPVGLRILDDSRQHLLNICVDSQAHNAIIGLLDGVTDVTTDPIVSRTIGNMFFWTRKVIKNSKFREIWLETMEGVNMLFDREQVVTPVVESLINSLNLLLTNDEFDTKFDKVVDNLAMMISLKQQVTGNIFFTPEESTKKPIKRSNSARSN